MKIIRRLLELMRINVVAIFLLSVILSSLLIVLAQQTYHFPVYPTREYMRPLRGGLQLEFTNRSGGAALCTLGYFARVENQIGIITVAHAIVPGANYVYQPDDSGSYYVGSPYLSCGQIDAVFVPLAQGVSYSANIIYIPSSEGWYDAYINGTISWENVEIGTRVCKTGRTTGTTCGVVRRLHDRINDPTVGYILDIIEANITVAGGDSGSPLYTYPVNRGINLLGHLVRATECYRIRIDGENNRWFNVTVIGPYEEDEPFICYTSYYVSVRAIQNVFGGRICTINGC